MKDLIKKSAVMLPIVLIGSAATIGYAHANVGVPAPVPSNPTLTQSSSPSVSSPETNHEEKSSVNDPAGGSNDQVGQTGNHQDATPDAPETNQKEKASVNDPAGGPNDQVGQTGNHQDATPDAPETGSQAGK